MGHRLDPGQEAPQLKAIIREARQAAQELSAVIKEAKGLAAALVAEFERIHVLETRQLTNFLTAESNRHAAALNADIEHARKMILQEIMAGELVLDPSTGQLSLTIGMTRFDDNQPLPYPDAAPKETPQ